MRDENIISKGFYRFPQVKGFISVKNHMFLQEEGRLYLALRFANDTEYTFDFFSFDIIELNADGAPIDKIFAEYKGISFAAGSMFSPDKAFAVSAGCVDFRIEFREAFSGSYKYTVRNGKVAVYYNIKEAIAKNECTKNKGTPNVKIKQAKAGRPLLSAVLIFLSLVIMAFCMARYLYKDFEKEESGAVVLRCIDIYEEAGVTYAEI